MIVNYAIHRSLNFMTNEWAHWRRFFFTFLLLASVTFVLEMGFSEGMIKLLHLFKGLVEIVFFCAFVYSLERRYGDEKVRESFGEELWAGLCFTPGFVLHSIILALGTMIGFIFLIVPGLYFWARNFANPYYSIINSDTNLAVKTYPSHFGRSDFFDVLGIALAHLLAIGIPSSIIYYFDTAKILVIRAALLPVSAFLVLAGGSLTYFFIHYLEQVRRKRQNQS